MCPSSVKFTLQSRRRHPLSSKSRNHSDLPWPSKFFFSSKARPSSTNYWCWHVENRSLLRIGVVAHMESMPTSTSVPSIHLQPPSVDFIDNHLPDHHEAFRNPLARYDSALQRYIPIPTNVVMQDGPAPLRLKGGGDEGGGKSGNEQSAPRVGAMAFWNSIFDDALTSFKSQHSEPKGRSESAYNIRNATNWDAVYLQLQLAREFYDGTKKGFGGRVKRFTRQVADHAAPAGQLARLIPDIDYASPVRAAVGVLLDVSQL
jgi:hypothetical protein